MSILSAHSLHFLTKMVFRQFLIVSLQESQRTLRLMAPFWKPSFTWKSAQQPLCDLITDIDRDVVFSRFNFVPLFLLFQFCCRIILRDVLFTTCLTPLLRHRKIFASSENRPYLVGFLDRRSTY